MTLAKFVDGIGERWWSGLRAPTQKQKAEGKRQTSKGKRQKETTKARSQMDKAEGKRQQTVCLYLLPSACQDSSAPQITLLQIFGMPRCSVQQGLGSAIVE